MPDHHLSIQYLMEEAKHLLWEYRTATTQPAGNDQDYVPPARFYLPLVKLAYDALLHASQMAQDEVPRDIQYQADQRTRQLGPIGKYELAEASPEQRRALAVEAVANLAKFLEDDLENEGRPAPPATMPKLGKMRR